MSEMSLVLRPSTRSKRDRLRRHLVLFLLAALPVAGVLWALVNWWVALAYVVVQTSVLMFGVGQERTSLLKVDRSGIQYEAQAFLLRTTWADIDKIGEATLPTGATKVFVLKRSGLRWAHTPEIRRQVADRGWDRVIPIDDFERSWPDGPLGRAVAEHRPDLLD